MSQTAEFIFFKAKPTVKLEIPNEEGNELLKLFNATKQQSGYHSSAWGRTVEDESVVAWVIVWTDARGASHSAQLTPFLEPNTTPTTLYTTLVPPITDTETLTTNPVTELVALSFPTSLSPDEHSALYQNLIDFRSALTEKLEEGKRPVSWSMGHVDRPGGLEHTASPSGKAFVQFLAVGWESVEKHMAVRETKEFAQTIQPIRQKALSPIEGLKMKHVSFKKI